MLSIRSANERIEAVHDVIQGGASVRPCCALLREMRGLRGSRSHMTPGHDQPGTVTGGEVAHPHSRLPNSLSRWSSAPLVPEASMQLDNRDRIPATLLPPGHSRKNSLGISVVVT